MGFILIFSSVVLGVLSGRILKGSRNYRVSNDTTVLVSGVGGFCTASFASIFLVSPFDDAALCILIVVMSSLLGGAASVLIAVCFKKAIRLDIS